ncbi:tetratricopeptide repeat protein [Flavobacteriaceae bacterium]|nr:tetratricopeptide repeat protein [Flavobacteriaceae bacterium]
MRKSLLFLFTCLTISACDSPQKTSSKFSPPGPGNYIEWFGNNNMANEFAMIGMRHFMNAEQEKAYTFFETAISYDSEMFAPHVCLAEMSLDGSQKQKYHISQAKKNVLDNNETSKLFVSILDQKPDGYWGYFDSSNAHQLWKKMHELEPRGNFIKQFYVWTIEDNETSIATINKFIDEAKSNNESYENLLNLLGYKLMAKGDMDEAEKVFLDYIKAYPEGYNAYDSMGEYYLKNEMIEPAQDMYMKALEKYRFANNARNVISKMNK